MLLARPSSSLGPMQQKDSRGNDITTCIDNLQLATAHEWIYPCAIGQRTFSSARPWKKVFIFWAASLVACSHMMLCSRRGHCLGQRQHWNHLTSRLESGVTRPNLARTDRSGMDGSTGSRWSLSARLSKRLVAMNPVTVYVIECELNLGLH